MRPFVVVVFATAFCMFAETATAAPDAGAKAQGSYNFFGRSAHGSLSSARSHVESYQGYLSDTHGVPVPAHAATVTALPVDPTQPSTSTTPRT